jgi:hypothetical protein
MTNSIKNEGWFACEINIGQSRESCEGCGPQKGKMKITSSERFHAAVLLAWAIVTILMIVHQ